jgi:hypothetical protein
MSEKKINRLIALGVFLITFIVYMMTLSRTVVFWDVGEFIAAAYLLQVPHPPGSPLFLLIGRVVSMIPFHEDIAFRVHTISAFGAAIGVMFLYLVSVKLIKRFRGTPVSAIDRLLVYGASVVGALSLAFCTTYWDNAIEAEVYGLSMLFVGLIAWLAMRWSERANEPHNEKYLFFIAYLIGLSIGVHLLALLAIFTVMLIVYFTKYEYTRNSFLKFGLITVAVFFVVYPGVVKWLPSMMDGEVGGFRSDLLTYIPFILIAVAGYYTYKTTKTGQKMLHIACVSFLLVVIGYSTYSMVIIRANVPNMPMNENNPSNLARLVSYLSREQYGDAPIMKRRYSTEPMHASTWQNYSSDMDFMFRYQINHMYVRYLLWNYVGAAGDEQDSGVSWKDTFGIPFLLGVIGLFFHFKKDWKMGLTFLFTFIIMGVVLALYQNQQEPQPRERDYFYIGSFFVFSMWVGMGVIAIGDFLRKKFHVEGYYKTGLVGTLALAVFAVPLNLLVGNWHEHDRSNNFVAWDYSYNILQTCERDAIIFTNGDNDTFPLWYLQDVEGVRRDVRIVNLSLVNTQWYIHQLKSYEPHGAKKVPISLTEGQIDRLQPTQWEARQMELPVPKEVFEKFAVKDTAVINKGKITFTMPHTIQFGNVKAIKTQDIMVWDIIRTNKWERPVYFAVTVSPDSKIGLDEYLWMDGLAWRLKPVKVPPGDLGLHADIMEKNILAENVVPSKEPQYGYLFRGLNDTTMYFDENIRRLTMNYRYSFIRLALHYQMASNGTENGKQVLARMESILPRNVIPMDWRLMTDLMSIYQRFGEEEKYKEYASEVEKICLRLIDQGYTDMQSYYNPYRVLLDIYDARQDYAQAIDILSRIQSIYPNDPSIRNRKQQYETMLQNQQQHRDTGLNARSR